MLWIEKYRPKTFDEITGQDPAVLQFRAYALEGNLPHLMLIGKSGTGKSSCLEAFSRAFYPESAGENTTVLQVGVMFSQGHAYFAENDRFSHLYDKNRSVLANFKYIVKWHASLQPLSAPFRMMVFDGAGSLPREAQQALRRIMERYSRTCRFVFIAASMSSIIDPIRSRCVPLFFLPIADHLMREKMVSVLKEEGVSVSDEDIELLIMGAGGDLRKALVWLELMALHGVADPADLERTETGSLAGSAVSAVFEGEMGNAGKIAENLMVEYGLSGTAVLQLLHAALMPRMTPELALLFADADIRIREGSNEYLQMNAFIAELVAVVQAKGF
jgi:replication factor C small subunit